MALNQREITHRIYRQAVYITTFYKSELSKAMQQVSRELDLNGYAKFSQYYILCELYLGESTLTALSEAVGVTLPNVSNAVNELCELGLVERFDDPVDRRKVNIRITPLGAKFSDRLLPYCVKVGEVLYDPVDEDRIKEGEELLNSFDAIIQRIQAYQATGDAD